MEEVVGGGIGGASHFKIKYVEDSGHTFSRVKYSRGSVSMVAVDAPQAFLNSVANEPDVNVIATASNIDTQINATQRNNIRSIVEDLQIPAQWVNVGDTRRQLARGLANIFLFANRVEGITGNGLRESFQNAGVNLNSQWSDLPQGVKNMFQSVADTDNVDTSSVTAATTVRQIMATFSAKWESTPIQLLGINI